MAWASCYTADFHAASTVGAGAGTTAANDRRLCETINTAGGLTFVADAIDVGRYAAHMNVASAATFIGVSRMASTPRYLGAMCRFRVASAGFTTNCRLLTISASTSGESIVLRANVTTGVLSYSFDNGAVSFTNSSVTLNLGQVYRLEAYVDFGTGTTHTLKVRVDGIEVVSATGGTATATALDVQFGTAAAQASMSLDFTDMVTYNDVAQYATLTDWRVIGVEPVSDGTHNFTDNDFKNAAGTNITAAGVAAMNTWDYVNDAPSAAPTTTDFVQQAVLRGTSYMEWVLRALPSGYGDPVLVCLAAAMHPVGGNTANAAAFRLVSGSNASAETAIDTSVATNTLEYRKHHYPTEPVSGAAWTTPLVRNTPLRVRFGYDATSITVPPAIDAAMAFLVCPVVPAASVVGVSVI